MVLSEILHRIGDMIPYLDGMTPYLDRMMLYLAAAGFASFVWGGLRKRHRFTDFMQVGGICACSVGGVDVLRTVLVPSAPELIRAFAALGFVRI